MNKEGNKTVIFEFETYMLIEKGLSKNSIESYKKDLMMFFKFLNEKLYKDVLEEDILLYIDFMEKNYKRNTILRKISAIKSFYNFLLREDYDLEEIPTANIEDINKGQYIPVVLSPAEVTDIIAATDNSVCGIRDRVIIKTIFATGARVS